jgi:hypothetical protein
MASRKRVYSPNNEEVSGSLFLDYSVCTIFLFCNTMYIQRRLKIMNILTLRINDDDNKLVRDYAQANNITISDLIRDSVLEKIENDIDVKLYNQAMKDHLENPQDISFDEMMADLGFDA